MFWVEFEEGLFTSSIQVGDPSQKLLGMTLQLSHVEQSETSPPFNRKG